jgi:phosphoribosylformylglycinamidine cyclo-ligase
MTPGEFDLAGFCVGVVREDDLLGAHRVREGDALVGLASSGLHANGYSLVRSSMLDGADPQLHEVLPELGRPLVDELLEPTAIYAPLVLELARAGLIAAAAHVTGGGIGANLHRVLPEGLGARVRTGSWPEPPAFELIRRASGAAERDMFSTFNMGLGMLLAVRPRDVPATIDVARAAGTAAFDVGRVVAGSGVALTRGDPPG